MMEQMTLSEIKRGMKVTLRDGSKCVVSNCRWDANNVSSLVDVNNGTWEGLEAYNENMTNQYENSLDIVEVTDRDGNIIFAEETMTRAEAEAKFGIRIVD